MRQRGKRKIGLCSYGSGLHLLQDKIALADERWIDFAHLLSRKLLRSHSGQPNPGMLDQDANQLHARIASRPEYCHAHTSAPLGRSCVSRHFQRFEYCGRLRALWWSYFFRSTARGSRVMNPAFLSGDLKSGLT